MTGFDKDKLCCFRGLTLEWLSQGVGKIESRSKEGTLIALLPEPC